MEVFVARHALIFLNSLVSPDQEGAPAPGALCRGDVRPPLHVRGPRSAPDGVFARHGGPCSRTQAPASWREGTVGVWTLTGLPAAPDRCRTTVPIRHALERPLPPSCVSGRFLPLGLRSDVLTLVLRTDELPGEGTCWPRVGASLPGERPARPFGADSVRASRGTGLGRGVVSGPGAGRRTCPCEVSPVFLCKSCRWRLVQKNLQSEPL